MRRCVRLMASTIGILATVSVPPAIGQPPPEPPGSALAAQRPDERAFRDIYRELVETDTTAASGGCKLAVEKMAARLRAAGFAATDLKVFAPPGHAGEGGLVARLGATAGRERTTDALLLVAHLDVVDVHRPDWTRDPFRLTEDGDFFYGRGVSDDKAMAAALVDSLIRLRSSGVRLMRTVKLALTCGEEDATVLDGAAYLAQSERALIDASLALVPTAGGRLDAQGRPLSLSVQAGEKLQQNFDLETTAAGGHSSRPVKNGAIADLARALLSLSDYDFAAELSPVTRLYFERSAELEGAPIAAAMRRLAATPPGAAPDAEAAALVTEADPGWNSMLRTTCAITLLQAGEALNALPRHVRATLNCRILPGHTVDEVQEILVKVLNDPAMILTRTGPPSPDARAPLIDLRVLQPAESIASRMWPGTPLIPTLLTGATDARFFNAAGIPTYGITTIFSDPDGDGVHAQDERVRIRFVYQGREFIYRLIQAYANRSNP